MTPVRNRAFTRGVALLLCSSFVGCAGGRLRDMFSVSPTADYKTLQELAEEERQATPGAAAAAAQLADAGPAADTADQPTLGERLKSSLPLRRGQQVPAETASLTTTVDDQAAASAATAAASPAETPARSGGPLNRLLSLTGRSRQVDADPFLDSQAAESTAAVQTEAERLAELDQAARSAPAAAAAKQGTPVKDSLTAAVGDSSTTLTRTVSSSSSEAEQMFASLSGAGGAEADVAADTADDADETAEPLIQPGKKPAAGQSVDELEAFLTQSKLARESRARAAGTAAEQATAGDNQQKALQLASAKAAESPESGESYADMFRALQAGFETPARDTGSPADAASGSSGGSAAARGTAAQPAPGSTAGNPFDSLLAGTDPAAAVANIAAAAAGPGQHDAEQSSGFDSLLGAAAAASKTVEQQARQTPPSARDLLQSGTAAAAETLARAGQSGPTDFFAGRDPFAEVGLAAAQSLADDAEFQWKSAEDARLALQQAGQQAADMWNGAAATANSAKAGANTVLDTANRIRNASSQTLSFAEFEARAYAGSAAGAPEPPSAAPLTVPPMHMTSMTRNAGLEEDPPFDTVSFESAFAGAPAAGLGAVTAAQTAPAAAVGSASGLSFRTWSLIVGGIIVAILLFAPKRNKPQQAEQTSGSR